MSGIIYGIWYESFFFVNEYDLCNIEMFFVVILFRFHVFVNFDQRVKENFPGVVREDLILNFFLGFFIGGV